MRKKFLSAFMLGALTLAATSTFVSCKDYDGDISALKSDVSALKTDLETKYNAVVNDLKNQKAELETKIASEKAVLDAAIKENSRLIAENGKLIEANKAAIAANNAAIAINAGKIATLENSVASLQTALAAVDARLTTAEADIVILKADKADKAEVAKAVEDLKALIATEKAALEAAIAKKADQTYVDAIEKRVKALEDKLPVVEGKVAANAAAIGTVAADLAALTGDVKGLQGDLKTLAEKVAANEADLKETMEKLVAEIQARQKGDDALGEFLSDMIFDVKGDLAEEVAARIAAVAELQTKIDELVAADEAINERIDGVQDDLDYAFGEIYRNADDITALQNYYTELEESLNLSQQDIVGIIEQLRGINGNIAELDENLNEAFQGILNNKNDITELRNIAQGIQDDVDMALQEIRRNADDITSLQNDLTTTSENLDDLVVTVDVLAGNVMRNGDNITELQSMMTKAQEDIIALTQEDENLSNRIAELNVLVNNRPTSLTFIPYTYVQGIESIEFVSIQYKDWNGCEGKDVPANWLADGAVGDSITYVGLDEVTAEYHVSPSRVNADAFAKVGLAWNLADETQYTFGNFTGKSEKCPVKVVDSKYDQDANKLLVKIAKTGTQKINNSAYSFDIIAVKAQIADKYLTAGEKGKEVNVYSDWARLKEYTLTPYIHNAVEDSEAPAHWYAFSEIYPNGIKKADIYTHRNNIEKVEWVYNQPLDMSTLVSVCEKAQPCKEIDYAKYGLSFEYNLVDYFFKNENETKDSTNHSLYAEFKQPGILTSKTLGGKNNKDAVGKSPVVQVVLRDKANNAVVDVRYIMVMWTLQPVEAVTMKDVNADPQEFECDEDYTVYVGEDYINYLAEYVDMPSKEFSYSYYTGGYLYDNEACEPGDNDEHIIGTVEELDHWWEQGQAHNLEVVFNSIALNDELCQSGKKDLVGYIKICDDVYGQHVMTVPVKFTVNYTKKIAKSDAKKDANYWKNDSYLVVNPTLANDNSDYSHKTNEQYIHTAYRYNLLNAWINVNSVADLVKNATGAKFVFDIAKIKEAYGDLYYVEGDSLKYSQGEMVAYIKDKKELILAEENINTHKIQEPGISKSRPTKQAQKFVAYDENPENNVLWLAVEGSKCQHKDTVENIEIRYEHPLKVVKPANAVELIDQLDGNSKTAFNAQAMFSLKEDFGAMNRTIAVAPYTDETEELAFLRQSWYRVSFEYYIAEAKLADGTLLSEILKPGSQSPKYSLSEANGQLIFTNNSGVALAKDLEIYIPAKIETQWKTWDDLSIKVVVKQKTTTAKK